MIPRGDAFEFIWRGARGVDAEFRRAGRFISRPDNEVANGGVPLAVRIAEMADGRPE